MILKNAALTPDLTRDLKFEGGRITHIATSLKPARGEECFDAHHRPLLPGLHDHHMHFLAYAASLGSLDCSAPDLQQRKALPQHLSSNLPDKGGTLRAIGYHEGSEALIDRYWLDTISATVPIRVQHRTGRLWIYNSAALKTLKNLPVVEGAERDQQGKLTGRFYHMDEWLRQHSPRTLPDIGRASRMLAAYGVTGFTDAGPDNDDLSRQLLATAQKEGRLLQRVLMMGQADLDFPNDDFMQLGACKIYLKESALPNFDELCASIAQQHRRNRPVAFHCVTLVELHVALAALRECGAHAGDRIEHASVCDNEALATIKALGISVVSQPNFIAERGDRYLDSVARDEQPLLYRAKSFVDAGIPFAGSTDAPFGKADPWLCMQAAVQRRTPNKRVINTDEQLSVTEALELFTGLTDQPGRSKRQLAQGELADCCLIDSDWQSLLQSDLGAPVVVCATWIGGELVYRK